MTEELKAFAESKDNKLELVSIDKLLLLKDGIDKIVYEPSLNEYQNFIKDYFYKFDEIPENTNSVIIMAISKTAYANVTFERAGKEYKAFSPTSADYNRAINELVDKVKNAGYEIEPVWHLPLKRLAVQSGLAEYGKNNIGYIQGFGCFFIFAAFYSSIPCDIDNWRETIVATNCDACMFCVKNCPTNAISEDTFIINAKRCISQFHTSKEEYPDWLPDSAHHTLYYCLKCQVGCPMNSGLENVIDVAFDENETALILNGKSFDDNVPDAFKKKVDLLGFGKWHSIERNLRVLLDVMDKGHVPKL
jgi:epoxyqueuosine reductase